MPLQHCANPPLGQGAKLQSIALRDSNGAGKLKGVLGTAASVAAGGRMQTSPEDDCVTTCPFGIFNSERGTCLCGLSKCRFLRHDLAVENAPISSRRKSAAYGAVACVEPRTRVAKNRGGRSELTDTLTGSQNRPCDGRMCWARLKLREKRFA